MVGDFFKAPFDGRVLQCFEYTPYVLTQLKDVKRFVVEPCTKRKKD